MNRERRIGLIRMLTTVLDEVDAEGLVEASGPHSYKGQVDTFVQAIEEGIEITPAYVRDVWLYWFGTGVNGHGQVAIYGMPQRPEFEQIAEKIRVAMSTFGG